MGGINTRLCWPTRGFCLIVAHRRPATQGAPRWQETGMRRHSGGVVRWRTPEVRAAEIHSYFLLPAVAAPAFGLADAPAPTPTVAGGFFLSALGFFGSRLLLFCPFAIAVFSDVRAQSRRRRK